VSDFSVEDFSQEDELSPGKLFRTIVAGLMHNRQEGKGFMTGSGDLLYQITSPLRTAAPPGLKLIQQTVLEYIMYCAKKFRPGRRLESF
jgi:hypothetical protein